MNLWNRGSFKGEGVKEWTLQFIYYVKRAKESPQEPNFRSFSHRDTSWRSRGFIGIFFSPSVHSCCGAFFWGWEAAGGGLFGCFLAYGRAINAYTQIHEQAVTMRNLHHILLSVYAAFYMTGESLCCNFAYLNQVSGLSAKACYSRGQCKPPASPSCPFFLPTAIFCV